MAEKSLDEGRIKELLKEAVLEVLEERRDLIYDVLTEAMEDFALAKAIQEGESSESIRAIFSSCRKIGFELSYGNMVIWGGCCTPVQTGNAE